MTAISVKGLGKAYKQYDNRWLRLLDWLWPGSKQWHRLNWVLQDLAFEVQAGEALGIIGINGAGKSTLLKIITGTTQATTGQVQLQGRVAALLELGMGFHPDFTGRQNAMMAAQLQGLSSEEIQQLMPSIEAFAEIGPYLDAPVRIYSSGMQMRLAFSVATAVRPDILIVDEALSVGDAYFQHKSFERIREFQKRGTTLLLVSHDKAAIQSICNRALLLSQGRKLMEGEPEQVMNHYNAMLSDRKGDTIQLHTTPEGQTRTQSGTGEVVIEQVKLVKQNGETAEILQTGELARLHVLSRVMRPVHELVVGVMIKDRLGQVIFGVNTFHSQQVLTHLKAEEKVELSIEFEANLGPGHYSVTVALHAGPDHVQSNYDWRDRALMFEVLNGGKTEFVGVSWLPHTLRIEHE
jgi:lipopolysaccharide transport system ATP-binding protein